MGRTNVPPQGNGPRVQHPQASLVTDILIVDDERDIADALAMLLQYEDYAVARAGDASAALNVLKDGMLPELIILDLRMPVMDGREFLDRKQADARLARVPVVILTADARARARSDLPADAVVIKPVDFASLLATVRHYVHTPGGPE